MSSKIVHKVSSDVFQSIYIKTNIWHGTSQQKVSEVRLTNATTTKIPPYYAMPHYIIDIPDAS